MNRRIAIVSPASVIDPELVAGACATLRAWGFEPQVGAHALGQNGSFSGTRAERLADMAAAMADPQVHAILCTRGGYGCCHLLEALDADETLWRHPKLLIGFSDVSALHALWGSRGLASLHSSMCKHLALGPDDPINQRLLKVLTGGECEAVEWNAAAEAASGAPGVWRPGSVTATVRGGNLAVTSALMRTPYDPFIDGSILLVEDIAEPIYKVERIFMQLRLSGVLGRLGGLVVGQFTDYRPSRDWQTMEEMLAQFAEDLPAGAPLAFNAPVGHIDGNLPVLLNRQATLSVSADGRATLSFSL